MTSLIQNLDEIATTPLRRDAFAILESGFEAIQTKSVVGRKVVRNGNTLSVEGHTIDLNAYDRVFFVGIGKCAAQAAEVLDELIGDKISGGIVIDVRGAILSHMKSFIGTHPLPSRKNHMAALEVRALLEQTTERDLVLSVISGGGSALLCLPHDLNCEKLAEITQELIRQGARIDELNTVRKHLSDVQGGQFAKLTYPAELVAFIFSDVPGNDLCTIASGPTVKDNSTKEDAEQILAKYDIRALCKAPDCEVIETPKDDRYFERVKNILLMTNDEALTAMQKKTQELGYKGRVVSGAVQGEARDVGAQIAEDAHDPHTCLIYGGETTVTVHGNGKGGRNQELALGALPLVGTDMILVAAASDGWDNSDVAGAFADSELRKYADAHSLDVEIFLERNDSYNFFAKAGGHIRTDRTGANVADMFFTLIA